MPFRARDVVKLLRWSTVYLGADHSTQALSLARPPSEAGEHCMKSPPPPPALRVIPGSGGASARRWIQKKFSVTQVKYGVWMTAGYLNLSHTESRAVSTLFFIRSTVRRYIHCGAMSLLPLTVYTHRACRLPFSTPATRASTAKRR